MQKKNVKKIVLKVLGILLGTPDNDIRGKKAERIVKIQQKK